MLPKPWGAAHGVVGMPLHVPPNLGRQDLERIRDEFEQEMLRLTEAAERWGSAGTPPREAIVVNNKIAA